MGQDIKQDANMRVGHSYHRNSRAANADGVVHVVKDAEGELEIIWSEEILETDVPISVGQSGDERRGLSCDVLTAVMY